MNNVQLVAMAQCPGNAERHMVFLKHIFHMQRMDTLHVTAIIHLTETFPESLAKIPSTAKRHNSTQKALSERLRSNF
jgi:hypothetical protein